MICQIICSGCAQIADVPAEVSDAIRNLPLPPPHVEAAIADSSLERIYQADRPLKRFDGAARARHAAHLEKTYQSWLGINAREIRSRVKWRFQQHVHTASLPAARLEPDQKEFKARYNKGRRELEHEFGKSMRYKSIRDLVARRDGRCRQRSEAGLADESAERFGYASAGLPIISTS